MRDPVVLEGERDSGIDEVPVIALRFPCPLPEFRRDCGGVIDYLPRRVGFKLVTEVNSLLSSVRRGKDFGVTELEIKLHRNYSGRVKEVQCRIGIPQ